MLHELRVDACMPGRLPDVVARFATVTLELWDKHGIRQAGFWTTPAGPSSHALTSMLACDSLAEREAKRTAFTTDPDWLAARAETEKNGPIVADFSSVR